MPYNAKNIWTKNVVWYEWNNLIAKKRMWVLYRKLILCSSKYFLQMSLEGIEINF